MSRCLNLTHAGEYAISALSRLALLSEGKDVPVSVEELSREQKLPRTFLAKILGRCARAGLVRTKKGPSGGVTLARPASKISLLSIVEACEGSYSRGSCVFYAARPCAGADCEVYCPLRQEEERLRVNLAKTNLAQMAKALEVHPDGGKS